MKADGDYSRLDVFEELDILDRNSPLEALKAKCQKLIKDHHPDKNGGAETDRFLTIMKVWKILNDKALFAQALASPYQSRGNQAIWDTVNLTDMEDLDDEDSFVSECRCGGQYILPKDCVDERTTDFTSIDVECEGCSNTIRVVIK